MEKSNFKFIFIPTFLLTSFLLLLLLFSFSSSATGIQINDYELPYSIPEFAENNSFSNGNWDSFITRLKSVMTSNGDNVNNWDWDNYIAWPIETGNTNRIQYQIVFEPSVIVDYPSNLDFYNINYVEVHGSGWIIFSLYYNDTNNDSGYNFRFDSYTRSTNSTNRGCLGTFDPYSFYGGYVQRFYPFILLGSESLLDPSGDIIFTNTQSVSINTGSAVEPEHFDKQQIHHQGHSRPGHVPIPPSYNSYTWNTYTPPSIDTSTLEALVESLFDLVKYNGEYFGSNIGGIINTFMSNVKLSFEYIGDSLDYHLGLIIDNIQGFMDNFYDNMASLFQPFFANFEGAFKMLAFIYVNGLDSNDNWSLGTFVHFLFIPDPDDLSDLLVSHDLYDVIGLAETTQTNMNTIKSMITGGNSLYKITIPQFSIMGVQLGAYDIDFSWYLSLKSVGDPIISAFLIFGYFLWLHARLPYWLRGQQGDIVGFAKEVQK